MKVERTGDSIYLYILYTFTEGWNGKGKFYHCASRTVLRLLWFLDFIYEIINEVYEDREKELSKICRESYNKALAHHHPWYIRTAFTVFYYYKYFYTYRLPWLLVHIKKLS